MADPDIFLICLKSPEISADAVRTIVETAPDCGFLTTKSGPRGTIEEYISLQQDEWQDSGEYNIDAVFEEIREDGAGGIRLWHDGEPVQLDFYLEDDPSLGRPEFTIHLRHFFFKPDDYTTRAEIESRIEALLKFVRTAVRVLTPEFGSGQIGFETGIPEERPFADHIENISWLTILHPDTLERLGGIDHVLATPVWRAEELETGHVMLVATDNPYSPKSFTRGPINDHLLGE